MSKLKRSHLGIAVAVVLFALLWIVLTRPVFNAAEVVPLLRAVP